MATKQFVITNDDGTVQIMEIKQQPDGSWPSVEDCLGKWHPSRRGRVVGSATVDKTSLPSDRTYRDAWRHDGKEFSVEMKRAREIHKDRMRDARAPLLDALDKAYLRADETGDVAAKQQVVAQKQVLRDVTIDPAIAAATTPDALKAVWPAALRP